MNYNNSPKLSQTILWFTSKDNDISVSSKEKNKNKNNSIIGEATLVYWWNLVINDHFFLFIFLIINLKKEIE